MAGLVVIGGAAGKLLCGVGARVVRNSAGAAGGGRVYGWGVLGRRGAGLEERVRVGDSYLWGGRRAMHTSVVLRHGGGVSEEEIAEEALRKKEGRRYVPRWRDLSHPAPLAKLPGIYAKLSKAKLSGLVVLTTMVGYAMAPGMLQLDTLLYTTVGTGLCVCSANAFNQWIEVPFDAQMSRTAGRVVVNGQISPLHSVMFALGTGITGYEILYHLVNPVVAGLGVSNIALYSLAYTWMKRSSVANTWVGAVVGGIPPVMGWAAQTGGFVQEPGAWLLGFLLYAWQFPHFNALSWNLREDYCRAGYRMMAVVNPALNGRVALRYSLLMIPCCTLAPFIGLTDWWFALDSFAANAAMSLLAWRFYRDSNQKTARKLFFASIIHLPIVCSLLMLHKNKDGEEKAGLPFADLTSSSASPSIGIA
eukprot:Nk52_evm7s148 gene=Nk52_evmTU7s148